MSESKIQNTPDALLHIISQNSPPNLPLTPTKGIPTYESSRNEETRNKADTQMHKRTKEKFTYPRYGHPGFRTR